MRRVAVDAVSGASRDEAHVGREVGARVRRQRHALRRGEVGRIVEVLALADAEGPQLEAIRGCAIADADVERVRRTTKQSRPGREDGSRLGAGARIVDARTQCVYEASPRKPFGSCTRPSSSSPEVRVRATLK